MESRYSYLVKITTWAEEDGVEEFITYSRDFIHPDLRESQKKASLYWSEQMEAFNRGEIIPGFLGPKDSEGEPWDWKERAEAVLYFVIEEIGKVSRYPFSGFPDEINKQGQEQERYALKTLGFGGKGIFD